MKKDNFHRCEFVTAIIVSYIKSLRGKASLDIAPIPGTMILDFVEKVDQYVDEMVIDKGQMRIR